MPGLSGKATDAAEAGVLGESDLGPGVQGISHTIYHAGVVGSNSHTGDSPGPGVYGESKGVGVHGFSDQGKAIYGYSSTGIGVHGETDKGTGVKGESRDWKGIHGESNTDAGVYGHSNKWVGIHGESDADAGVYGRSDYRAGVRGESHYGDGVRGKSESGSGVVGESKTSIGVWGISTNREGVRGETQSDDVPALVGVVTNAASTAPAVYGEHRGKGDAVHGSSHTGYGVYGFSDDGEGVRGETDSATVAALVGVARNPNSYVAAVYGEHKGKGAAVCGNSLLTGYGVYGISNDGEGVRGETNSANVAALVGVAKNPESTVAAVYGEHKGKGSAVYGYSNGGAGVQGVAGGTGAGVHGENKGEGPAGLFDGRVVVTGNIEAHNVIATGADCAEYFDVAVPDFIEPGTVMIITDEGALRQSERAYDKRVAGVISGAGDYKPGLVLDKQYSDGNRALLALLGKAYCKVDARHGAIEVGDLLTSSATPGHAMKVADPFKAFGAVIGKALLPLKEGTGLIPILITLQ